MILSFYTPTVLFFHLYYIPLELVFIYGVRYSSNSVFLYGSPVFLALFTVPSLFQNVTSFIYYILVCFVHRFSCIPLIDTFVCICIVSLILVTVTLLFPLIKSFSFSFSKVL